MSFYFTGAALMLFSGTALGWYAASMYKRRAAQLGAFHGLIVYIGAQIGSYLTPLFEIYEKFEDPLLEECGFLSKLRENGGEAALSACRKGLYLSDGDVSELEKFFSGLGRFDGEHEVKHCAYYEKLIFEAYEKIQSQAPAKVRMYRTLGMLMGIMLAVILL